jgi:hypothetical protein
MAARDDGAFRATGDAHAQARDQGAVSEGDEQRPPARRRDPPRLTERAKGEREARARRVAAEMRENLLKRKRQQRALREREEGR